MYYCILIGILIIYVKNLYIKKSNNKNIAYHLKVNYVIVS